MVEENKVLRKKLKLAQQKSRRLTKKCKSLEDIVQSLNDNGLISTECQQFLNQNISSIPKELVKRLLKKRNTTYPPELRSFAMTLQYYSAKAYEFVRTTFNLALPHQSQIRKWYSKIPAGPGFTQPAFQALEVRMHKAQEENKQIVCALMLDEMAIRKHVSWNGKSFQGYVDLGCDLNDDDSAPMAKNALVFMAVALNESWKVPCGYFLIDSLTGKERANLVTQCIQRLYDVGVTVSSLTCDGPSCHFTMLSTLGAKMKVPALNPSFQHPSDSNEKVHVFLDVCHMLKLVRNTFSDFGVLKDNNGECISWQYLVELHKLQEQEGLRLGNKMKSAHLQWQKQKMKVNLASQVLSASVADALEYCVKHLKLPQFDKCAATVKFIRVFDHLFDVLNSRNPVAKGYKSPMRQANRNVWDPFLDEAYAYILALTDGTGNTLHSSRRKTGFIGFLAAIKSVRSIFQDLVSQKSGAPLKYLLTYKLSQDHLELFFSAVRAAGGFNNNPTAQQFTASYKRLLLRSAIKGGKGNVSQRDNTTILEVIEDTCHLSNDTTLTISETAIIRKYDLKQLSPVQSDHDYCDMPNITILSEYKTAAISYIAGYVVKMVEKRIICSDCLKALKASNQSPTERSDFVQFKSRGSLILPSKSVRIICEETEKCFGRLLAITSGKPPQKKGVPQAISLAVLGNIQTQTMFPELDEHMIDSSATDNHIVHLTKQVVHCYCTIRLHHLAKQTTQAESGPYIRKQLNKLILFNHQ